MPWPPGQSGNPKGRPAGRKTFSQVARKLLTDHTIDNDPIWDAVMQKLIDRALKDEGDVNAIRLLALIVDGRLTLNSAIDDLANNKAELVIRRLDALPPAQPPVPPAA